MSAIRLNLPPWLQRKIIEHLQQEWYLRATELHLTDRSRLIVLRPSIPQLTSPLLVNRMWHLHSTNTRTEKFCGVLDMTAPSLQTPKRLCDLKPGPVSNKDRSAPVHTLSLNFRHLYSRVTTLRVDSGSMHLAALLSPRYGFSSLVTVHVNGKFDFPISKGQLLYSKTATHSQDVLWTKDWENYFSLWIDLKWASSCRHVESLYSTYSSFFFKQTFVLKDLNAQKLVSESHCPHAVQILTCSSLWNSM